ncbi:MAG: DUF3769 domain-containing protein [Cyanobacteria bacterium J06639_14]
MTPAQELHALHPVEKRSPKLSANAGEKSTIVTNAAPVAPTSLSPVESAPIPPLSSATLRPTQPLASSATSPPRQQREGLPHETLQAAAPDDADAPAIAFARAQDERDTATTNPAAIEGASIQGASIQGASPVAASSSQNLESFPAPTSAVLATNDPASETMSAALSSPSLTPSDISTSIQALSRIAAWASANSAALSTSIPLTRGIAPEVFAPGTTDATPSFTAATYSASAPIPPLSRVMPLPSLRLGTAFPPTNLAPSNNLYSYSAKGPNISALLSPLTPAVSTPIPPLSQVIALPPLPPDYPSVPIPVTQDSGLQISTSERTDAAALQGNTRESLRGHIYAISEASLQQFDQITIEWALPSGNSTQWAQNNLPETDPSAIPELPSSVPTIPSTIPELPNGEQEIPTTVPDIPTTVPDIPTTMPEVPTDIPGTIPSTPGTIQEVPESIPVIPETVPTTPGTIPEPSDTVPARPDAVPATEESTTAEPATTFPQAATPEPFWHNGAVLNNGTLLPPSEPTNRQATPIRFTADYQEFEPFRQVVTARGDVTLQLDNGALAADRLWANLFNRYVLVEGNVVFRRGEQIIEAERGEYNLLQGQGSLFDTRGALSLNDTGEDFATLGPGAGEADEPISADDVRGPDPLRGVRTTGGITFGTGNTRGLVADLEGDGISRVRFEATQVDFDAEGWIARDVRLTNDPFSPPELELRGDTATLTPLNELEDELVIENPRLVFDQGFSLPLLRSRYILRRGQQNANPLLFGVGFDSDERGGLFIERTVPITTTPPWDLRVTPQLLVQRLTREDSSGPFASNFGLVVDLNGQLTPKTTLTATADLSGLDLDNFRNRLRASVRLRQQLPYRHTLNLEYSYRDRLFNGSLGFENIQSSIGAVITSPQYTLGDTGIILEYQVGAQYVTAISDRDELIGTEQPRDLVSLGRFQGSLSLRRSFTLWRGNPLPATPDAGLRFTPRPIVPNIRLTLRGRGTFNYYTSNDTQESASISVGLRGQFGHFSRDFLDSTTFNLTYRQSLVGEATSPFRFDRDVDRNVVSGGIIQQIYGPFRAGFQTSVNLDTGRVISTNYIFEYSRRTYGVVVEFNPERRRGFVGFRLNDFGWSGRTAAFGGTDVDEVEEGVIQ